MEIAKISSKGQVVIPRKIREELGLNKGSIVTIGKTNGNVVLKKIDENLISQFDKSLENIKKGKIKKVA